MKQFALALLGCTSYALLNAQNLVPNPSFEEYLDCPQSTGELGIQVVDWYSWQFSPDFFHPCNNEGFGTAGVPANLFGYQLPISGDAYSGVITFIDVFENDREYMAAPLSVDLEVGASYYLMFHVSLSDSSETITRKCATNNLGMRFFKDPTYSSFPSANAFQADNFAHLNSSDVISDDQNWTLIEGWFTADDSYNWVAIGNFFDDQNTTTVELNNEKRCSAFYYIENVCVATNPSECDNLLHVPSISELACDLKVYPNPTTDLINVQLGIGSIDHLILYDSTGRLLKKYGTDYMRNTTIDVSSFQAGIYILSIQSNKQSFNRKIIVK